MEKEMDSGEKRLVSVRLLKPEELEGNTIYVVVEPAKHGNSSENFVSRAFSGEDFRYKEETIPGSSRNILEQGSKSNVVTNLGTGSFRDSVALHYELFIEKLGRENNAQVRYSFLEDGFEMVKNLEEIRGLTGII
ncbi:MAG: hypothetical protein KJI71_05485 [Patescibacteria group bacterium]|nr:hypothetical protein [Patescibacteria group bacterium]